MKDYHAGKRAAREQQSAVLRWALEELKTDPPRTYTPLANADEARDERDPLTCALEKLRAEEALPVTPESDSPLETPDMPELSTEKMCTLEPEVVPSPGPIEKNPLPGGGEGSDGLSSIIERENQRLAAWAEKYLARTNTGSF
jgi:hypothetical protein